MAALGMSGELLMKVSPKSLHIGGDGFPDNLSGHLPLTPPLRIPAASHSEFRERKSQPTPFPAQGEPQVRNRFTKALGAAAGPQASDFQFFAKKKAHGRLRCKQEQGLPFGGEVGKAPEAGSLLIL